MTAAEHEFRLLLALLLNALPVVAAWRLARRLHGRDLYATAADAALFTLATQYVAVGAAGLLGVLGPGSLLVASATLSAAMWTLASRLPARDDDADAAATSRAESIALLAAVAFVVAFYGRMFATTWIAPPLANDPLTYHLPAAVHWLQAGSLSLYETWFHSPANTFSPLGGSMFLAWWIAPLGNDFLGRYGQSPAALLLLFAIARVARDLGAPRFTPPLIALAAVFARPMISQGQLAKDDLYVAAFFAAALAALAPAALRDRGGVARLGLSIGLLLAMKYTVVYAAPVLLLAIDAPRRAGWSWRRHAAAVAVVLLVAGPWYLRNFLLTANPLFPMRLGPYHHPIFDGPLWLSRDPALGSLEGIWQSVVTSYYGVQPALAITLALAWLVAIVINTLFDAPLLRDPLRRAVLIGSPIALVLYVLTAPYAEGRFTIPVVVALLVVPAMLGVGRAGAIAAWVATLAVLAASVATSFIPENVLQLYPPALLAAAVLSVLALAAIHLWPTPRGRFATILAVVGFSSAWVYVYWSAFIEGYRVKIEQDRLWAEPGYYPGLADAWYFVRTQLPPDATLAYTNTAFTYPLYGFDLQRRVIHVPMRSDILSLRELHGIPPGIPGKLVIPESVRWFRQMAERTRWLERLDRSGARYLLIGLDPPLLEESLPPELSFAAHYADRFRVVFQSPGAVVLEVRR